MSSPVKRTVKHGAISIAVREYADGRYGFDYKPPGSSRIKVRLNDIDEAEKRAKQALGATHAGKLDLLAIDEDLFAEFLAWKATRRPPSPIPSLVARFLSSKESKGRSEWTIRDLRGTLEKFALAFPDPIANVSSDAVEKWLSRHEKKKGVPIGARRWNNLLAVVIALYRFARREGDIGADLMPVERIERRAVKAGVIETYSPAELKLILDVVPEDWLPVVVLGAFAGMRPEELCPGPYTEKPGLRWENILWSKRKVDVPQGVSKVRRRRFVPLNDAAIAFLEPYRRKTGEIAPRKALANYSRHWSAASGVTWKADGLRHSYASYRLAITKDIAALALELGNSPAIIFNHYLDLKHDDEAEKWFAIRPASTRKVPKGPKRGLPQAALSNDSAP